MIILGLALAAIGLGTPGMLGPLGAQDTASLGGDLAPAGPRYQLARVRPGEEVELRDAPNGDAVKTLGPETEFNSPRTFYVAELRDGWLGVPNPDSPNGTLGWIRNDAAQLDLYETSYALHVDLAARQVLLRWGNHLIVRIPVTVGRPGSETPPGTFSVTDGLAGKGVGPYYGCCVLALSGHQPNLPSGWIGGDRIAIHGTPGAIGGAASLGCLRASDPDMVSLFGLVPLGTPVFISA